MGDCACYSIKFLILFFYFFFFIRLDTAPLWFGVTHSLANHIVIVMMKYPWNCSVLIAHCPSPTLPLSPSPSFSLSLFFPYYGPHPSSFPFARFAHLTLSTLQQGDNIFNVRLLQPTDPFCQVQSSSYNSKLLALRTHCDSSLLVFRSFRLAIVRNFRTIDWSSFRFSSPGQSCSTCNFSNFRPLSLFLNSA